MSTTRNRARAPVPAYFWSLEVENVRCFGPKQTLDLSHGVHPAKWTVLLGDNGVGKTTLLECLYAMAPEAPIRDQPRITIPRGLGALPIPDPRNGSAAVVSASVCFDALISAARVGHEATAVAKVAEPRMDEAGDPMLGSSVTNYSGSAGPSLCCAYPAARRFGRGTLESRNTPTSDASPFLKNEPLINAAEWLLQADYAARRTASTKAAQRRDAVKRALIDLLPDVSDIRESGLDEDPPRPRVEVHTPYGWVGLRSLSLGYQTMVAWLVDLANRMFEAYPDSETPLAEAAVVLIDELDLHLHPRWQRAITSHIDRLFPNAQFIVSAHSPLVVQAPGVTNVAVLRRREDYVEILNDPEEVRGWRVDQILTSDLFGLASARPIDVEEDLNRHRELTLLDNPTQAEARELAELDTKLSRLPPGEIARDRDAWSLAYDLSLALSKAQDTES